jgi:hypothetical protein
VDWSLFGCARKGHVTYAPDETDLRDRLTAPTSGGAAWRCLRCGAFVTGEPWLGRRWGEYFAMVATSVFLPYEVYDLTVKITWLRVGALVINLLLVVYLVWTKRLFGVRGGKQAYEARLRTESFIEVEQAALAAAAPRNAGSTPR